MSFVSNANTMTTSMFSVTLSGLAFSAQDVSPSIQIGFTSCQTTTWASGTSLVCHIRAGDEPGLAVQVAVSSLVGTQTAAFTFDGTPSYFILYVFSCSHGTYFFNSEHRFEVRYILWCTMWDLLILSASAYAVFAQVCLNALRFEGFDSTVIFKHVCSMA